MRVVVTGGAGFIGSNLVEALAGRGHVPVAVDDLSTGDRRNLEGVAAELVVGSVVDPAVAEEAVAGADAVVHLAALPSVPRSLADPVATHRANTEGTLQVLQAARSAGGIPVVVASSSSVYGANPTLPKREDLATRPLSPYAATKAATEAYALAWAHSFDLRVLVFRFFNVFGPRQGANHPYAAVVPRFVAAALRGEPLPVDGDGHQSRDFTAVGSVVRVLADAVERGVTSADPVNLAFGSRRTLLELVAELQSVLGAELAVEHGPPRTGDVRHSQADATTLRSLFPDVTAVPFAEALSSTVEWFRADPTRWQR